MYIRKYLERIFTYGTYIWFVMFVLPVTVYSIWFVFFFLRFSSILFKGSTKMHKEEKHTLQLSNTKRKRGGGHCAITQWKRLLCRNRDSIWFLHKYSIIKTTDFCNDITILSLSHITISQMLWTKTTWNSNSISILLCAYL